MDPSQLLKAWFLATKATIACLDVLQVSAFDFLRPKDGREVTQTFQTVITMQQSVPA